MEKIKTGLAAFGMSGQIFHAPFISTNPAFCLTAITERSKELSKERYPSARIVRSFEELVALDELELVVINTPDSTHYEYGTKALGRLGKCDCRENLSRQQLSRDKNWSTSPDPKGWL